MSSLGAVLREEWCHPRCFLVATLLHCWVGLNGDYLEKAQRTFTVLDEGPYGFFAEE